MKFFFLFLLSAFLSLSCTHSNQVYYGGGTSIIIILDEDSTWIVADSRRTIADENGKLEQYKQVCKIAKTKNVFYTFASPYVSLNIGGYVLFDAYEEMKKAIETNNSFDSAFIQFDQKVSRHLAKSCREDSLANPAAFFARDAPNVLFQCFMLTYKNGKPLYKIRQYYNKGFQSSPKAIEIANDNSHEEDSLPIELFFGHREAIDSFFNLHPNTYVDIADIKSIGPFMINLEARSTPDVDSNVNIIGIGKDNGYKWILKTQSCQ